MRYATQVYSCMALLTLSSCGDSEITSPENNDALSQQADVFEYRSDLQDRVQNLGRWYNYIHSELPCNSGFGFPLGGMNPASCLNWLSPEGGSGAGDWIVSEGPWWVDQNHAMSSEGNGFGLINIIAFMQLPSAFKSAANLEDSTISFESMISSDWSTVAAPSRLGYLNSHVYLWFQTAPRSIPDCLPNPQIGEDCTRQSDYILMGNGSASYALDYGPMETILERSFLIDPSRSSDWVCLGAGRNVKYDCMEFETAVRQVQVIGFMAGPVLPCPVSTLVQPTLCDVETISTNPFQHFNLGRFSFRNFKIRLALQKSASVASIFWREPLVSAKRQGFAWSPIRYGDFLQIDIGGGLRLRASQGYTRFGLAQSDSAQSFSEVGPQVYTAPWSPVQGSELGQVGVIDLDESGRYVEDKFVSNYAPGDVVELMLSKDELLVLKNDEVVYRFQSDCSKVCGYFPFSSQLVSKPGDEPVSF